MRQSSVRGDRSRRRRRPDAPDAQELGWDDGLYEDKGLPPDAPGWTPSAGGDAPLGDGDGDGPAEGDGHRKGAGRAAARAARCCAGPR